VISPQDEPTVSVLIPTYNAEASIATAIQSALAVPADMGVEVVVVDDASTDGTATIVEAIAAADPRVTLLRMPENAGVSAARNRGLEAVRGEWLTLLDADDRFTAGGLAALVERGIATDALAVVGQQVWSDGRSRWISHFYDNPDVRRPGRGSLAGRPRLLYFASPHAKLYRRSLVAGLLFRGRVLGDQPWVIRGLLRAGDRLEVIGRTVYEWRRPPRGVAGITITGTTRSSVRGGIEAASVAAEALASVAAEAASHVADAAARDRLLAAYLDRLLSSDLGTHLAMALRRSDPDLGSLLDAIRALLEAAPPDLVRESQALAPWILEPPLAAWGRLDPAARRAYESLVQRATTFQPDVVVQGTGPPGRLALRIAARWAAAGGSGRMIRPAGWLLWSGEALARWHRRRRPASASSG